MAGRDESETHEETDGDTVASRPAAPVAPADDTAETLRDDEAARIAEGTKPSFPPPSEAPLAEPVIEEPEGAGTTLLRRASLQPEVKSTDLSSRETRRFTSYRLAVMGVLTSLLLGLAVFGITTRPKSNLVVPGVFVANEAYGDIELTAIDTRLTATERRLGTTALSLVLGQREVRFEPSAGGFAIRRDTTQARIAAAGRDRGFFSRLIALGHPRVNVTLDVALDREELDDLFADWDARLIDDHPIEGGFVVENDRLVARAPTRGRAIDRDELVRRIEAELQLGGRGPIAVPVSEVIPRVSTEEAARALAEAEAITRAPVVLAHAPTQAEIDDFLRDAAKQKARAAEEAAVPKKKKRRRAKRAASPATEKSGDPVGPPPIEMTFDRADLLAAITSRIEGDRIVVGMTEAVLRDKVKPLEQRLGGAARDARFDIDDKDQITVVPSRPGFKIVTTELGKRIAEAAKQETRRGELPVDFGVEPNLTTEAATALGIRGLVSSFTTHHPCCQPRVLNIHRIADMMDGVVVKPGETFSVNAFVGPRTSDRGFFLAPSIGDGEMVDTVGGGISQFATTLFNALFDGGYGIKERQAHSFYFTRYPLGIEATLSYPSPDLAFINDTKSGLLIKASYTKTSITVKLFGDNEGRKVERSTSGISDLEEPKTEYEADDRLAPDEEKVKEKGSSGFSVHVARTIVFATGEKREEKRKVRYKPRPRLVHVHSCNIPKGEPGHTGKPCPEPEKTDTLDAGTPEDPSHAP